jgi:hypothetical protein
VRTEIVEYVLNLVAGHRDRGEPRAVAPSSGCRPRIGAFEEWKSVPWQEMSTFGANGAVERRGRILIGRNEEIQREVGKDQ